MKDAVLRALANPYHPPIEKRWDRMCEVLKSIPYLVEKCQFDWVNIMETHDFIDDDIAHELSKDFTLLGIENEFSASHFHKDGGLVHGYLVVNGHQFRAVAEQERIRAAAEYRRFMESH